ncbi:helix-turn-helix domain-containing protein [Streptomyces sp. NPDC088736]|uniref:helix-turn-helix domain-containing protein n=1 Tax=Streptomyces sp. NPDC088736 TaxID=3365881 RepID=UPI003827C463
MARVQPAGVWLSPEDCARLEAVLLKTLRDMQIRDGGAPEHLVDVVAVVRGCAREFRTSTLVTGGSGTTQRRNGSAGGSSVVSERLTTQEAARLARVSDGYVRRLARRGDVMASRSGGKGEWLIDASSLAVWVAERRT